MVSYRSPKPLFRVRILVDVQKTLKKVAKKFFSVRYFVYICTVTKQIGSLTYWLALSKHLLVVVLEILDDKS